MVEQASTVIATNTAAPQVCRPLLLIEKQIHNDDKSKGNVCFGNSYH